jgi:hypothetical protein
LKTCFQKDNFFPLISDQSLGLNLQWEQQKFLVRIN